VRVVITGASSGIGEALAQHYAREGATLGLISRRPSAVQGQNYCIDVTDQAAVASAAEDFIRRFGPPDLVIANAGIGSGTEGAEIRDVAKLAKILDTNVVGLAATLAAFAPAMRAAGRGTLAGIASVAGFRGLGNGVFRPNRRITGWRACAPSSTAALRGMHLPRLHRHADDAREPLSHAVPACGRRGCAAYCPRDCGETPARGDPLADGAGVGAAARDAGLAVRPPRLPRAAQA
jgi:NAD(P)-dependent dehydrogenase (short-subunit alcohol dehydrogenase family)